MLEITGSAGCTGCAACAAVCPTACITMTADAEGFVRPQIDAQKCVDCGKCARSCPVNQNIEPYPMPRAYAAINRQEDVRRESSSGGVFALLAAQVLQQGGAVCGAVFDSDFTVRHVLTDDPAAVRRMQGSKYVQSDLGDCLIAVRDRLQNGKPLLFSGTPCQIGGLRALLGKPYDNLITQDIICHGVPSPAVWQKYLAEQSGAVQVASFRDKSNGWLTFSMRLETTGGLHCETLQKDPYLQLFLRDLTLRPSCYECAFKSVGRAADLTLADYWGVQRAHPSFFDNKGTSLVLVHSAKGEQLMQQIAPQLRLEETDLSASLAANSAVSASVACPPNRSAVFAQLGEKTVAELAQIYCRTSAAEKAKGLLRRAAAKLRGRNS